MRVKNIFYLWIVIICMVERQGGGFASTSFSDMAWEKASHLYQSIQKHPFNVELAKGTLPQKKFDYYKDQDALYLPVFAKALTVLLLKVDESSSMLKVFELVKESLKEIPSQKKSLEEMSPATFNYTNFLLATSAYKSREELAAALLPCFWIYARLSEGMKKEMTGKHIPLKTHPYLTWIEAYVSSTYQRQVNHMILITNQLASHVSLEQRSKMLEMFLMSFRMELSFWDAAYQIKHW